MKKVVKLSSRDVKNMVEQIVAESKKNKKKSEETNAETPKRKISKTVKDTDPRPNMKKIKKTVKEPYEVDDNRVMTETRRNRGRIVRLNESEMIEFLDKLAKRVENNQNRR
jgi:hypothetical protein